MKKITSLFVLLTFSATVAFAQTRTYSNPGKGPIPKDLNRPSVALVLSGGGINGAAEVPVLEELEKLGIPVDIVLGTSIGAIVGALYCCGYSTDDIYNLFLTQDWPTVFADFATSFYENLYEDHGIKQNLLPIKLGTDGNLAIGKGISKGQKAYQLLKTLTAKIPSDIDFDNLPIPFRCIATDMETGEAILFSQGDLAEAIRASMNVAGLFEPLNIDGRYLLDGGLTNNLPVNIAKEMGYDIIIAVDISPASNKSIRIYETSPLYTLQDSIYTPMRTIGNLVAAQADLVISPDMAEFEITDFDKAAEIYNSGKIAVQESHEKFVALKNKLQTTEEIKGGNKYVSSYKSLPYLSVDNIEISGAFNEDISFIDRMFKKHINRTLDEKSLENFTNSIYRLGHYKVIQTRVNDNCLHLILTQKLSPSFAVLASFDSLQTLVDPTSSSFSNINLCLQARGLTTVDSIFSIRATFLSNWSAELLFFQPFSRYCYASIESTFMHENFGTDTKYDYMKHTISFGANHFNNMIIKNGICFNQHFLEAFSKFNIDYMNQPCFAEKGFKTDLSFKLIEPSENFIPTKQKVMMLGEVSYKVAIPFGKKVSLSLLGFGGIDFTEQLSDYKNICITEGYNNYDRVYFPFVSTKEHFSDRKFCGAISLQFSPIDHLTIAGGKVYFIGSGSYGTLSNLENGEWSSTLGCGVRAVDSFNALLRIGVFGKDEVKPFISFDIGNIYF